MISHVSANELDINETDGNFLCVNENSIYVDDFEGNDLNDGLSYDTSVKSLDKAISLAKDNDTIYISSGNYASNGNTRLTIDKSISLIGSDDTTVDGLNKDYLFTIADNVEVTFKNIKFVNAYKVPNDIESVYGSVLDIRDAKVTIENCSFTNNLVNHNTKSAVYGGAISNLGDLTIINSYFINNTVATAESSQGLFSEGGSIYNRGRLTIKNTTISNSKSGVFSYGAAISNRGELEIDNSVISGSYMASQSRGSAVYNTGNFILTNSIIKDNFIEKYGLNLIYGAIYNEGNFTAYGNLFSNNSAGYDSASVAYKGSPTIYNNANLNLTYNAFIDNEYATDVSCDVYYNGGEIISLDNNWWNTNDNPAEESHINVDDFNSWLKFTLTPTYTPLNISDSVIIKAEFKSVTDNLQLNLLPVLNVTFKTLDVVETKELTDGSAEFVFSYTQNKGLYEITADVCGFEETVEVDVGKLVSNLDFNLTDNIEYFDTLKINVTVNGNGIITPTGQVFVNLDNKRYVIDLVGGEGNLEIANLTPNKYNLTFTYMGSDEYFKAFANTTVTVRKQPVNITLTIPSIKIDEKVTTATVNLTTKGAQGQAVLYLNGVRKQNVYLYNGVTTLTLRNLAEGQYNATLVFIGNDQYESANISTIFRVSKYSTILNIYADDINITQNATILIEALPEDLRGEAILSINGINQSIWIDNANTTINITDLNPGLYEVSVIYLGDSKYYGANDTTSFRVIRPESSIDVDIVKDDETLNGTITVKTNSINCTGLVGVYINYKFYSMNLTDGKAVFNVEFDQGTNYVFVYYEGNSLFEGSTWNTTIGVADNFVFIGQNSTSFEHNDFNYSVRLIELTGIPMPNRNVTVQFMDNIYYIISDDDGFAYLPLNLAKGKYNISATYENKTIINTLTVEEITFEISINDTYYGEIETVEIKANENLTGKFNLNIAGEVDVTVDIEGGKAVYNISGLNTGKYTLNVKYVNDYFNSTVSSNSFEVKKANLNVTVSFNQKEFIITANNLENASGNITFIIDNAEYSIIINNSQAALSINLSDGNHTLKINYEGDSNYNKYELNTYVYVKIYSTDILLSVEDVIYGENVTVIAKVNADATGIIDFEIANVTKSAEIQNGIASLTFSGLNAGNYTLKADYLGDTFYLENDNSTSFEVSKADSTISVFVNEAILDENIRIYANLSNGATGSVLFSMEGYYSPRYKNVRESQAQWYISPLTTGSYTVYATYIGDNNFNPSNTTYILNISQKRLIMQVNIEDVRVIDRVAVNVKLSNSTGDPVDGVVKLDLNSRSYDISVRDGEANLVIGKFPAGNYSYTASFEGNEIYAKSTVSGIFEVRDTLLNVVITAYNLTKYYSGNQNLSVIVKTVNGKALSGVLLYVRINNETYEIKTDDEGKSSLEVNLNPGNYTAEVILNEDETYHEASANATVTVLSTVEGIDLIKLYGSSNQYFAIFCDANGNMLSNTEVKFLIGSKSYKATTLPNGIVRLNIDSAPGNYTIIAINPKTNQRAVNNIFIFNYLVGNKNLVQYYGANKVYKVRAYNSDGKIASGVFVKIKVKGKTYKIKTDKNGYARRSIGLIPGEYVITANYNGYTVSNKVIVKPVLSLKKISVKGKKIKYSVKLVNSKGKIAKKTKVIFKFKGKKYTVKTNKKGIATLKVNKYLKVGKHKIHAYYGKSKLTQIISVR